MATGIWGPHLIVVRTCKLLNWEVEFKRWCPGLKILLYLGNKRERRSMRMVKRNALFMLVNWFHSCFPHHITKITLWWLIYSGGGKPIASMYVWHPTSCWWKTSAILWGRGGNTWSWMRCSSSKIWCRNTGRQSLLSKGERLPNILMGQYPIENQMNVLMLFIDFKYSETHFKVRYFFF